MRGIVQKLYCLIQFCDWMRSEDFWQPVVSWRGQSGPPRNGRTDMSVYLIADIKITNDGWVAEYASNVHKLVEKHGGRYLSRSGNIETIEGAAKDSTLIAILEFPTREALDSFAADPDYAPYGQARQSGSVSNFHVIDDTDIAGAIPYLKAG
mmetsp:Transcript_844/g.1590  ORF Transcript_844/g.1590 Transcript_844/m.1590 type:complete len:152 (-) Transcript_844:250-705(-)